MLIPELPLFITAVLERNTCNLAGRGHFAEGPQGVAWAKTCNTTGTYLVERFQVSLTLLPVWHNP